MMDMWTAEVKRIGGDELAARLRNGEDVVVVDARAEGGYEISNVKPRGAVRIAPGAGVAELPQLPRGALLVSVCT